MDTTRKNTYYTGDQEVELSIEEIGQILNQLSYRELNFLLTQSEFSEFQNTLIMVQGVENG